MTPALNGIIARLAQDLRNLDARFAPRSFRTYRDPDERFELGYPAEWRLKRDGGVHVSSARMGSFARVDVVPAGADFWSFLERAVDLERGTFRMDSHRGGRARGVIRMAGLRFAWDGTVHPLGDRSVVLTLGNVLDSRRNRSIEAYEDRVFAAIRRSFKLGPGPRRAR